MQRVKKKGDPRSKSGLKLRKTFLYVMCFNVIQDQLIPSIYQYFIIIDEKKRHKIKMISNQG